jgi:hypothetical protein
MTTQRRLMFGGSDLRQTPDCPLPIGSIVGAGRWPQCGAGADRHAPPWQGTLLAQNDPRAWQGSLAFGFRNGLPDPGAVNDHVAWCKAQGLMSTMPVLWDFGVHGHQVHWERPAALRPYAEDLAAWHVEVARVQAYYDSVARTYPRIHVA